MVDAPHGSRTADPWGELLLAIARKADRQAYERLFCHFAPRIKSWMIRAGMAPDAAEELAQEAMLTAWRRADCFQPARASAATWLFTIARNLRVDRLRRERNGPPAPDPSDELPAPPSGEDIALCAERDARVHTALAALSAEQAAIIRLSFLEDQAQAQIARDLRLPLGTVKSRTRLAVKRLRQLLEDMA